MGIMTEKTNLLNPKPQNPMTNKIPINQIPINQIPKNAFWSFRILDFVGIWDLVIGI